MNLQHLSIQFLLSQRNSYSTSATQSFTFGFTSFLSSFLSSFLPTPEKFYCACLYLPRRSLGDNVGLH